MKISIANDEGHWTAELYGEGGAPDRYRFYVKVPLAAPPHVHAGDESGRTVITSMGRTYRGTLHIQRIYTSDTDPAGLFLDLLLEAPPDA